LQCRRTRRLDREDAAGDGQERDIERAAAEVEDEHDALLLRLVVGRVEAVGDGGSRGLVDDAEHVEARDRAGVLRRQALRVVEAAASVVDCSAKTH